MKIRLKNKSTVITPRITEAYNHETKSAVAIEFDGVPGAYETTVEDLNVAADCLVNRGWELVSPPVLSCPVIRNPFGFMHPDEFVFSARAGWLTREGQGGEREAPEEVGKRVGIRRFRIQGGVRRFS